MRVLLLRLALRTGLLRCLRLALRGPEAHQRRSAFQLQPLVAPQVVVEAGGVISVFGLGHAGIAGIHRAGDAAGLTPPPPPHRAAALAVNENACLSHGGRGAEPAAWGVRDGGAAGGPGWAAAAAAARGGGGLRRAAATDGAFAAVLANGSALVAWGGPKWGGAAGPAAGAGVGATQI